MVMQEKFLVPELRFSEFSEFWKKESLGFHHKIYDGTHQTPEYVVNGIPFYSVENVTSNDFTETKFISEDIYINEVKRVVIEQDDILMTRIGDIGTIKYIDWEVKASFYVSLALIKQSSEVCSRFLSFFMQTQFFQKELWKRTIHVAFPRKINLGEVGNCDIVFPNNLNEQQKIAAFLSAVDNKLTHLRRKHELLESYKHGVMQQLFSQQIRFKQDDGSDFPDWEEKKLREFVETFSGGTPTSTNKNFYAGDIPFIKSGEISESKTEQFISALALKNSSAKMVMKGDLLYALYGATSGEVAISKIEGAINQAVLCIRGDFNTLFLFYYLELKKYWIKSTYLQGGQGNLSADIVKSMDIAIPIEEEQQKIANFLQSIDHKIDAVAKQINQLDTFKKGLLQKLFV